MAFTTPIHTNAQSIERVLAAGLPLLLVFWRKDCPPCQQLDPALDRMAAAHAGRALIAKIDAQDQPTLVQRYSVTHLPGLIFIKDRQPIAHTSGAIPESALHTWLLYLAQGGTCPPIPQGPSIPLDGAAPAHTPPRNNHPIALNDSTFDQLIRTSALPILVDFWAPWCGPCRAVAPIIDQLAQEFAGRAIIAKLNVDENQRTSQSFGITGIPALYIFKQGRIVERLIGAQPATALRQALARHVG